MEDLVIITRLMQLERRGPLRQFLFERYLEALLQQKSEGWRVLLVGPDPPSQPLPHQISYLQCRRSTDVDFGTAAACSYLADQTSHPRYVLPLDDDDIIAPDTVSRALEAKGKYDALVDSVHVYYDVTTGLMRYLRPPFFPNSTVHNYRHAARLINGRPLLAHPHHLEWRKYYEGRRVMRLEPSSPTHIRVLSPASETMKSPEVFTSITRNVLRAYRKTPLVRRGMWLQTCPPFNCELLRSSHEFWLKEYGHLSLPPLPARL